MGFCTSSILLCRNHADAIAITVGLNGTSVRSRRLLQRISPDRCIPWCVVVEIAHTTLPHLSSRAEQDLRNHGTSPHAEPHSYSVMASDVLYFFRTHHLLNVSLLGHSM